MENIIGKNYLEKHIQYKDFYKNNILYWGLGIENELYLQFDKTLSFPKEKFLKNHKSERYSVDYYTTYKKDLKNTMFELTPYLGELPLLMNSHSFSKTDKNNNSKTLYTKKAEPNPNFDGSTLWELILEKNEFLKKNYKKSIVFDGDSIELITTNFFNVKINDLLEEYSLLKNSFIANIQNVFEQEKIFSEYGKIKIMEKNNPYAVFLTNINNVAMFNNGTIHINITLPTLLDNEGKIKDIPKFVNDHKNFIRLIQFLEPILITVYGSPDPFSKLDNSLLFSASSQRCAVSRYIGVGTYDTDVMKTGKILTEEIDKMKVCTLEYGWYNQYYEFCGYNKLEKIGYDINFNKHYNHGIEIRFFEHQEEDKLKEIIEFLTLLADYSLEYDVLDNPILIKEWNDFLVKTFRYGKKTTMENIYMYNNLFETEFLSFEIVSFYYELFNFLKNRNSKKIFSNLVYNIKTVYELIDEIDKSLAELTNSINISKIMLNKKTDYLNDKKNDLLQCLFNKKEEIEIVQNKIEEKKEENLFVNADIVTNKGKKLTFCSPKRKMVKKKNDNCCSIL